MNKENSANIIGIIPAAGRPTNRIMVNSNLPDAMLPINGKPVIDYIINDLLDREISEIFVILNRVDQHTEKYLIKKFINRCPIQIIYNDRPEKGVGYSIYLAAKELKDNPRKVLICLGDTIYKGKLNLDRDFLVVSKNYEESNKWCFVEEGQNQLSFINKPKNYTGPGRILSGIYFLNQGEIFKKASLEVEKEKSKIEMSDILEKYGALRDNKFELIEAEGWYDCGNIENYYKAKIDFLRVRDFNSITYNDLYGFITKTSPDKEKLTPEIYWFQNVPQELKIFTPRLINHSITDNSISHSLEFYGYQSLADMFIFGYLDLKMWQMIIQRLFEIINLFKKYKKELPFKFYEQMYYEKTIKRISQLKEEKYWQDLLEKKTIRINGKDYKNFNYFLPQIKNYIKNLYTTNEMCFIHGDLCLSNVLFDPGSRIFKFVDPRGEFGEQSIYGDLKYDLAKLRHSFSGCYDFIISDLFELKEKDYNFDYNLYTEDYHQEISQYFDKELTENNFEIEKIKFIEALLFLSMLPLHKDNFQRQKAMYLTGIKLINQINPIR